MELITVTPAYGVEDPPLVPEAAFTRTQHPVISVEGLLVAERNKSALNPRTV